MTVPPCEIPGFGKGALPPGAHEAESFLEEVEDVTRLVDGLRSGKVSAEYVDRVLREKDEETEKKETRAKEAKEQAEKTKYDNLPEEKKTEVREKVAEMMREKERRERARELYAKYQETLGSSGGSGEERRRTATTDYTSWDLWTPSDDEEDPWMTFTPGDNPAFKAMEADIDKRHERQVRQRQTAHRAREAGNAAFKAGQFAEALKTYEKGLESDKRSIELHGNAAMAALKCGCFAQTIEHCDRACELAEFFLERPAHPTAVKCLLRRAAARDALAHFAEAVADLERAAELDPDDGEIVKKLATARRRREDARAERALKRRLRNAKASTSRDGDGDGDGDGSEEDAFAQVVRLEKLMRRVGGSGGSSEDDGVVDYDAIEVLLAKHEACRVFARGGGGVGIGKLASRLANPPDARVGVGAAKALAAACASEANCECLASVPDRVLAVARFASPRFASYGEQSAEVADASFHALEALRECSRHEGPRGAVVAAFARLAAEEEAARKSDASFGVPRSFGPFGALKDQLRIPEDDTEDAAADARRRVARAQNARCALAVFGNLALDPGARALAKRDFSSASSPADSVASEALRFPHVVGRWIGSKRGDGETTRLAAAAIGNGCADPAWRAACVSGVHGATLVRRLFEALPVRRSGDENARERTPANAVPVGLGLGLDDARAAFEISDFEAEAADFETAASVLAALSNVLLEPSARAWVRTNAKRVVEKLLPWLLVTFGDANVTDVADAETSCVSRRARRRRFRGARAKRRRRARFCPRAARAARSRFVISSRRRHSACWRRRRPTRRSRRRRRRWTAGRAFWRSRRRLSRRWTATSTATSTATRRTPRRRRWAWRAPRGRRWRRACVRRSPRKSSATPRRRRRASTASATPSPARCPPCAACRARSARRRSRARGWRRAPHMAALKEHHGLELIYAYVWAVKTETKRGQRGQREDDKVAKYGYHSTGSASRSRRRPTCRPLKQTC